MSTTLSDKPLSQGSLSPDVFSGSGYRAPHDANSRKRSGDDKARSDDDAHATRASAKKTAASVEDAQHFEEAMRSADQRSEDRDSGSSAQEEPDTQEDENEQDTPSEMSFASLFAERFDAGTVAETGKTEATPQAESSQRAESLAQRLAERILVSETSVTGQEVRIQPSRDILPDTEICLVRGSDGLLSAVIHTDNPNSFQTLAAAQHDLRERLEQSEGQPVHVELRSSTDDGDPNRRSRGLDLYPRHE